jgi:hypothetical protein
MVLMTTMPTPTMLYTPTGFYCTYCDFYFFPELDRSGLPDRKVRWIALHIDAGKLNPMAESSDSRSVCPLIGKMFEIDVTEVFPAAREVGVRRG